MSEGPGHAAGAEGRTRSRRNQIRRFPPTRMVHGRRTIRVYFGLRLPMTIPDPLISTPLDATLEQS